MTFHQHSPHILIVDSNILWTDNNDIVSPAFNKFWDAYSPKFKIKLCLPEVVLNEILYQKINKAKKEAENATKALNAVFSMTGRKYTHRCSENKISDAINKKLIKWKKNKRADIIKTPTDKIDWNSLVNNAVWRNPPFDPNKEGKGFRDALILETVASFCSSETNTSILFISNDRLLRETAKERIKNNKNFEVFQSLLDCESRLKLLHETQQDEFSRYLIAKATKKFFSENDPNCFFTINKIKEKILEDYTGYFLNPELEPPSLGVFTNPFTLLSIASQWVPSSSQHLTISEATFFKKENDLYFWKNIISFSQNYQIHPTPPSLPGYYMEPKNLLLNIGVIWKSKVNSAGKFIHPEFDRTFIENKSFIPVSNWLSQLLAFNMGSLTEPSTNL